jgi:hypothetical protein
MLDFPTPKLPTLMRRPKKSKKTVEFLSPLPSLFNLTLSFAPVMVFLFTFAIPFVSAACMSGGNKTGTLLLGSSIFFRYGMNVVTRSEDMVIDGERVRKTWINDTTTFEDVPPDMHELSCETAFAVAVPSYFVGTSLGDVDGWAMDWLGHRWSSAAPGTPGTVDISMTSPQSAPQPTLWQPVITITSESDPLRAVSSVLGGTLSFPAVNGDNSSISTTRIVLNHWLRTETTLIEGRAPLLDQRIIQYLNTSTFFAPFARAALGVLEDVSPVNPVKLLSEESSPLLLEHAHDFVRVCTCDHVNQTERCPPTIHYKALRGPSHICPPGAFVIKRHVPSASWRPLTLRQQFSCVLFQEPPPSIVGVHNLTNDQLIVTIDGCRMVYDHGAVHMGGFESKELLAFTLKTARCRSAAYFVGCGPLIVVHSGRISVALSTVGTGSPVREESNVTNALCHRCAEDFGAYGSEAWCRCCLANCQNSREFCNSEGYCQPGGHTCPNLCPVRPICPLTEPVPPPADGRKCAGVATDQPPPPAPTPPGPPTTTAPATETRILLTPSPFKLPPCIAGSSACSGDSPSLTPAPTPTPRAVPCEFNRFTGRCSRDDCPAQPLTHKCAMQIANKTASCSCAPLAPCEWSDSEQRCVGGGGAEDGSICAANGSPCWPIHRSDGKIVCNATCFSGDAPEKSTSTRLGALASLRSVAPARAIAPIAVGINTALSISSDAGSLALAVDWRSVAKAPTDKTLLTLLLRYRDELLQLSAASTSKTTSADLLDAMNRLWFAVDGRADSKPGDPCELPLQSPASLWWRPGDTRNVVAAFDEWWTRAATSRDATQFDVRLRVATASDSACRSSLTVRPLPATTTTTTNRRNALALDEACCAIDVPGSAVVTLCVNSTVSTRTVRVPAPRTDDPMAILLCDCALCNVTLLVQPATPIVPALLQADRVPPLPAGLATAPKPLGDLAVTDETLSDEAEARQVAPFVSATTALGVLLFFVVLALVITVVVLVVKNRRLSAKQQAAEARIASTPPPPPTLMRRRSRRSKRSGDTTV